jgi:plasmid maintenance system antidote protein VapI
MCTDMARKTKRCEPLDRYIGIHGISISDLALKLAKPEPTVRSWVNGNRAITAEVAVFLERKLEIPRETFRPDIFVKRAA